MEKIPDLRSDVVKDLFVFACFAVFRRTLLITKQNQAYFIGNSKPQWTFVLKFFTSVDVRDSTENKMAPPLTE